MKIQTLSIFFIFIFSSSYAMHQAPQSILLQAIMTRALSIEKNSTPEGTLEYKATLIDQDLLICKKNRAGKIEAHYLLYLHYATDRKKAGGKYYEKIDLEVIRTQPDAVLKALKKKFKEQNNTINKHSCALT